jgi:LPS export ABC transporter protein LptC
MLKDPRNLLWIAPLAALLTLPLWKPLAADILSPVRKGTESPGTALTSKHALSASEMNGVQFEQSRNGLKEWLMTAGRLYSTESDSSLQFEDVKGSFFGVAGEKDETRIRSQKAGYDEDTGKITLLGKVVIQNDKGYEIRTESLEYLVAEKKIRSTSAVSINGGNFEVSGNRLLYDTRKRDFRLEGNVVCRIW